MRSDDPEPDPHLDSWKQPIEPRRRSEGPRFSLSARTRASIRRWLLKVPPESPHLDLALDDIETSVCKCVVTREQDRVTRAQLQSWIGARGEARTIRRAILQLQRVLPKPSEPTPGYTDFARLHAELSGADRYLTPSRKRPRGRPQEPHNWQLAWNVAVTLQALGSPVSKYREGVFAGVLIEILSAIDDRPRKRIDQSRDVFHIIRRIAATLENHPPGDMFSAEDLAQLDLTRRPLFGPRPRVQDVPPCFIPDWAREYGDITKRLDSPPIALVARGR